VNIARSTIVNAELPKASFGSCGSGFDKIRAGSVPGAKLPGPIPAPECVCPNAGELQINTRTKRTESFTEFANITSSLYDFYSHARLQIAGIDNHLIADIDTGKNLRPVATVPAGSDWLLNSFAVLHHDYFFDTREGNDRVVLARSRPSSRRW